jgi:methionyl-tRNA formyltransferase
MENLNDILDGMTKYSIVYVTSKYELFGFINGNREINPSNLEKIKESLKTKQILESAIIVGYSPNDSEGKIFKIFRGTPVHGKLQSEPFETDGKSFLNFRCADGVYSAQTIQPEGKKRMEVGEFLRGWRPNAF